MPILSALGLDRIVDSNLNVSIIVRIEVLGFKGQVDKMQEIRDFLDLATTFYVNDDIADKTIDLRKTRPKLKLGDAIIAATALVNDFIIITRNIDDFKHIEGLKYLNPHEIE